MNAQWSLGVLVGLPIAGVLTLGFLVYLVLLALAVRNTRHEAHGYDRVHPGWLAIPAACLVVTVGLTVLSMYPFKAEYHQWRPVTGAVASVSSRIISDGNDSVNQRFVVKLAGSNRLYGCDDTRCSTVKAGDTIALKCKREWEYASVPGYGCRWAA